MSTFFSKFNKDQGVQYGFSKRENGSMNRFLETENRTRYFQSLGFCSDQVVTAGLSHGTGVFLVGRTDGGTMPTETDALVTKENGLLLTVTGADCFILYFYDPRKKVIGIAHAGWRGIMADMPSAVILKMQESFDSDSGDILVGVGPGIRKCHFEISVSDQEKFQPYPEEVFQRGDKCFVDLPGIIKEQLESSGVRSDHIEDCGMCTFCEKEKYFSYRRDKPKEVQPMVGYISLV